VEAGNRSAFGVWRSAFSVPGGVGVPAIRAAVRGDFFSEDSEKSYLSPLTYRQSPRVLTLVIGYIVPR
jgi:hypothetical protein